MSLTSMRAVGRYGATCMRLGLTTLAVLFVFVIDATAATYYVSQSGNDSNSCATAQSTTESNQKQTISAGVACLSAGDTL